MHVLTRSGRSWRIDQQQGRRRSDGLRRAGKSQGSGAIQQGGVPSMSGALTRQPSRRLTAAARPAPLDLFDLARIPDLGASRECVRLSVRPSCRRPYAREARAEGAARASESAGYTDVSELGNGDRPGRREEATGASTARTKVAIDREGWSMTSSGFSQDRPAKLRA